MGAAEVDMNAYRQLVGTLCTSAAVVEEVVPGWHRTCRDVEEVIEAGSCSSLGKGGHESNSTADSEKGAVHEVEAQSCWSMAELEVLRLCGPHTAPGQNGHSFQAHCEVMAGPDPQDRA